MKIFDTRWGVGGARLEVEDLLGCTDDKRTHLAVKAITTGKRRRLCVNGLRLRRVSQDGCWGRREEGREGTGK